MLDDCHGSQRNGGCRQEGRVLYCIHSSINREGKEEVGRREVDWFSSRRISTHGKKL